MKILIMIIMNKLMWNNINENDNVNIIINDINE